MATLTASRASFQAIRKMRLWAAEGYAALDFAERKGTLVRPSDQLLVGDLGLSDVDLTKPAAIKEHVFGKILRVDRPKLRAYVEGIRLIKKHVKKSPKNQQGGIIEMEGGIHISNLKVLEKYVHVAAKK